MRVGGRWRVGTKMWGGWGEEGARQDMEAGGRLGACMYGMLLARSVCGAYTWRMLICQRHVGVSLARRLAASFVQLRLCEYKECKSCTPAHPLPLL